LQNKVCCTHKLGRRITPGFTFNFSPEVWKDLPYDNKSDIWSLGCVLYEITTLKPPFRADDMEGLYKKVIRGFYPKIPAQYS
jgi:NIMA (never in mitosis gene a)-related kinase